MVCLRGESLAIILISKMTTSQITRPQPKSKATAYAFWCAGFFGICGLQRFYAEKTGSGILYLLTLGVFGMGQLIDLFLTAEMVDSYNRGHGYNLPGAYASPLAQQQVVVNVGENIKSAIAELQQDTDQGKVQKSEEQAILKACVDEPITAALITVKTGIQPKRVKELVEHLELEGMLAPHVTEAGKIKYWIN